MDFDHEVPDGVNNATHFLNLNKHCRICFELLDKGQKGKHTITSYNVSGELRFEEKFVRFRDLLLQLWQFRLDCTLDDLNIHPQKFCKNCYSSLRECILNPNKTIRIVIAQFVPHNEDIKSCQVCKLHSLGRSSKQGRPAKPKRGRRKNDPVVVQDGSRDVDIMHSYAQKVDEPCPTIKLAREILLSKCRDRGSSSTTSSVMTASDISISDSTYEPLSSPSEGMTPVTNLEVVSFTNIDDIGPSGVSVDPDSDCNFAPTPKIPRTRGPGKRKTPLPQLKSSYSRNRRLQPIISSIENALETHHENVSEIWPYLSKHFGIDDVSQSQPSPLQSLAYKVSSDFNDSQYKLLYSNIVKQTRIMKTENMILAPFHTLKSAEVQIMPGFARFELDPPDHVIFPSENHLDISQRCVQMDILDGVSTRLCTTPPNMVGQRFRYDKAVAQTLIEYKEHVETSLKQISDENTAISDTIRGGVVLDAYFKDGADGLGEINQYKGKTFRVLPNNAMRYAFSLMQINLNCNGTTHVVYKNVKPNSIKSCRTLMNAIADENDCVSSAMCILPIEREKVALQGKILRFIEPSQPHSFRIHILTTMVDEKYERHYRGLEPSSANFCCTVCTYNKAKDKDLYAEIPEAMRRTRLESEMQALSCQDNQANERSREGKDTAAKGVRARQLVTFCSTTDESNAIMDATHADINVSSNMFKTIYVREIAKVYEWNETSATREKLSEATAKFNSLVLRFIGNPDKLMQGGNYGKELVNFENIRVILHEAQVEDSRIKAIEAVLELYNKLRRVWRATFPEETCPFELRNYQQNATKLGQLLRDEFSYYVKWTPYLHKILAHVPDAINATPLRTCGGLASEASEARNKNFRKDRKFHSRPNLLYELGDNLRWAWLSSSFLLQELAKVDSTQYKCGFCGKEGHNRRTCPFTSRHAFSSQDNDSSDSSNEDEALS